MHRRSVGSRSTHLAFALALLALGVILPFLSAFSAPAAARAAASVLPTAHVLPGPEPSVVNSNQRPATDAAPPLAIGGQPPAENGAALPAPSNSQDQSSSVPTPTAIEAAAVLPVVPTITPVPLGQVGADAGAPP